MIWASPQPCTRAASRWPATLLLVASLGLAGCQPMALQPLMAINGRIEQAGSSREPALSGRWLALIVGQGGRERVELLDLERGLPVPLPALNRTDAQPLSVSIDAAGERLALVRQLEGRTELVLYRRSVASLQLLRIQPEGVPRRVQLRADGRLLAVEVSRQGLWQIDLFQLP